MSQPNRSIQLSEAEIRAIYAEGEEAVVSLVSQLLERLNSLEAEFSGHAVHDGWKSDQHYDCQHVLCNAHHLRELQYIWEQYGQAWAFHMSLLLVTIHHCVKAVKARGETTLPTLELAAFETRYQAILDQGFADNPLPPPTPGKPKKRGRPKRSPPRNEVNP